MVGGPTGRWGRGVGETERSICTLSIKQTNWFFLVGTFGDVNGVFRAVRFVFELQDKLFKLGPFIKALLVREGKIKEGRCGFALDHFFAADGRPTTAVENGACKYNFQM